MPTKLDSLFHGARHYHFKEIDSTNKYAIDLLSKSTPVEGTLVTSDFQTHGRGQYGRDWMSESTKNLLFSIILYPQFLAPNEQFQLSRAISLALCNTILTLMPSKQISIKWPNDIYCNDKKIAGILIQNSLQGNALNWSVIGCGINVNQTKFPIEFKATSLLKELGINIDKKQLLNIILSDIKTEYMLLRRNEQIQEKRYNDILYGRNEDRLFEDKEGNRFVAKVLFVNRVGNLIIDRDGDYKSIDFGDIKWI